MGVVIRRGAWPRIFQACAVPCERATGLFSARASPHHRLPFPAHAAGRGSLEEGKEGTGQRRNAFPAESPRLPASKINRASRGETARALACTQLPAASRGAGGRPPCRTGGRGRGQRQEGRATRRPGSPPAAPRSRPPEELRDRRGGEERAAPGRWPGRSAPRPGRAALLLGDRPGRQGPHRWLPPAWGGPGPAHGPCRAPGAPGGPSRPRHRRGARPGSGSGAFPPAACSRSPSLPAASRRERRRRLKGWEEVGRRQGGGARSSPSAPHSFASAAGPGRRRR